MRNRATYTVLFIVAILGYSLFTRSCANTTTPPSGGPRDTLPPILEKTTPPYNATNVPTSIKKNNITFEFDEYVVLKDVVNNIYLSPPQSKKPTAKLKGRGVVVSFQEPLDSNTTYSLDLGQAITDNHEGNFFPNYVFSFSTGSIIDSMFTSGTVLDSKKMLPVKGATVLLHTDPSDSAVFNLLPVASAKTDSWGYFSVRNLKPGSYRVFAIEDKNNNNKYDPGEETIAFLDSLLIPDKVMHPNLPELTSYDVKDTVNCLARPSYMQLYLFKEITSRHFIKNKGRFSERSFFVSFSSPNPEIHSISFEGIDSTAIITQFNQMRDSMLLWINDQKPIPDTISLSIKYMKTNDSLKVLEPFVEEMKLIRPKGKMVEKRGKMVEIRDSVSKFTLTAKPENVEQDGYIFDFDYPLIKAPFESLKLTYINLKQQKREEKFTVVQDSTDIRRYVLRPDNPMVMGNDYILKFPHRLFFDINNLPCDSLDNKLTLPNNDKLSSLTADMQNVKSNYIVELINEKRDKVLRSYRISADTKLLFPYLSAAKYSIRITEDKNNNGLIDTGSLLEKRQPEKVLLYKFNDGITNEAYLIDIPERMEIEQTIDLSKIFE